MSYPPAVMSEKKSPVVVPVIVGIMIGVGLGALLFAKCPPTPIPAGQPAEGKAPPVATPAKVGDAPAPAQMHAPVAPGEVKPVASPEAKAANP